MSIELWAANELPYFLLPRQFFGFLLVILYSLLLILWLIRCREDFWLLGRRGSVLMALLGVAVAAAEFLVVQFPSGSLLTPPGLPAETPGPAFSLFGAVPSILAGGLLGVGPALLVGLMTGLARGLWQTHSMFTPFEMAFFAGAVASLLRQDFRGWLAAWLRHPLLAVILVSLVFWLAYFPSYLANSTASGLAALDYVAGLVSAAIPALVAEGMVGGVVGEMVHAGSPGLWPQILRYRPAPYATSLNRRLLYSLVPLTLVGIGVLFWADTQIAIRVARDLVVDQMGRSAVTAGWGVPFFIQTGRSLIKDFARAPGLRNPNRLAVENQLSTVMRTVPYFVQLAFFDSGGHLVASFPAADEQGLGLSAEERQAVELALRGVPQEVTVEPTARGSPVQFTFLSPVAGQIEGSVAGALLGRTNLVDNPLMNPAVQRLQGLIAGQGEGFVVDEQNRIIYHTNPDKLMESFEPEPSARTLSTSFPSARAYEDRYPDGTRRLVFFLPVSGHPWSVVVMVPHQVVLELATKISTPLLVILILMGSIALLIVLFVAGRLTRPLEALAAAAGRFAEARSGLELPIQVTGEDEVGRLGKALEHMRVALRDRLGELSLLLRITQGVAASLNLDESLQPILQAALSTTGAGGVRIMLPPEGDLQGPSTPAAYAAGASAQIMAPLDKDVLALTREEAVVRIDNLSRARAVLDVASVAGKIQGLLALPLRQEARYYGAMWLGYTQPHLFTQAEINFLTTLAGQAAVAVANANLFKAAESGRRRLAATLASTSDAVIVTDNRNRLLLFNPAAEAAFRTSASSVTGRPVREAIPYPDLAKAVMEAGTDAASVEVELSNGRTLVASISAIVGDDGQVLGRVAVLRDVTQFKTVDALKSEFVATVSHDLRAPLTLLRGYATMLPMVGALTDKQKEFTDRILLGVEQMTILIEDLLDLGRIEAGIGLEVEPIQIDEIVSGVAASLRQQAANAGSSLTIDVPRDMPEVYGDKTLLKQALTNLVVNAIKYSPNGGEIRIRATQSDDALVLSVKDQGIGIAPADQLRLFEKFYRVKQRQGVHVKGSGLGLAIVKSVAERHGGKAWLESRLGQGSTFYFSIPMDGNKPPRAELN